MAEPKNIADGFMLIYCKDERAHNVVMSEEQLKTLQDFITAIFQESTIKIIEESFANVGYIGKDKPS